MIIPVVNKRINGVIRPLGVTEENRAEVICFNVAFPGCEEFVWYLVYRKNDGTGSTVPLETDVHDGAVLLAWNPTREVTSLAGSITVMLKGITEDGRVWESIPSSMTVVEGIDPNEGETEEPSVLDSYLIKFQALYNKTLADASERIDEEALAKVEEITEAKATAISAIDTESSEAVDAISRLANLALDRIDEEKSAAIGAIEEVKDDYVKIVDDYAHEKTVEIEAATDAVKKAAIQELTEHEENLKEDLDNHTSSKKSEITDFTEEKKAELQETSNAEKRGVSEEGTRQKNILNKAASDGINDVNNTRDGVITSVQEKGSEQIGAVQSAGDEEVSRVQGVYQDDYRTISAECERQKLINKNQSYRIENLEALAEGRISEEKSITTENGSATLENEYVAKNAFVGEVRGKTWAWNQLLRNEITHLSGDGTGGLIPYSRALSLNSGHLYMMCLRGTGITGMRFRDTVIGYTGAEGINKVVDVDVDTDETTSVQLRTVAGTPFDVYIGVVDMTVAFGVADISKVTSAMEQSVLHWIVDHNEYVPVGTLQSSRNVKVKSVGANLTDGKWVNGRWNNGWTDESNYRRLENIIDVKPNTEYYLFIGDSRLDTFIIEFSADSYVGYKVISQKGSFSTDAGVTRIGLFVASKEERIIAIFEGSTPRDYVPYSSQIVDCEFLDGYLIEGTTADLEKRTLTITKEIRDGELVDITPVTKTFAELGINPPSDWSNDVRIEGGGTISVLCEGAQAEATIHYLKKYVGGTV